MGGRTSRGSRKSGSTASASGGATVEKVGGLKTLSRNNVRSQTEELAMKMDVTSQWFDRGDLTGKLLEQRATEFKDSFDKLVSRIPKTVPPSIASEISGVAGSLGDRLKSFNRQKRFNRKTAEDGLSSDLRVFSRDLNSVIGGLS